MKAMLSTRYGGPEVMALGERELPAVGDEQVLVRVRATAVNAQDWHLLRGRPVVARLTLGLRAPKEQVLGTDVAGVVEAVGRAVTHVAVGDAVFGSRSGAFAEYVSGRTIVALPAGLSFEEAAAIPTAGQTALIAVREQGRVRPGQRVLVNGASGGVATFALQIAKADGAEVTAVTKPAGVDLARSLGADHVLDYTREDFTQGPARYDVILDAGGTRSLRAMRRVLAPGGTIVLIAPRIGSSLGILGRIAASTILTRVTDKAVRPFLARVSREHLLTLKDLVESGAVRPVIDRAFTLAEIPDAIRHLESGRVLGKVVVQVSDDPDRAHATTGHRQEAVDSRQARMTLLDDVRFAARGLPIA